MMNKEVDIKKWVRTSDRAANTGLLVMPATALSIQDTLLTKRMFADTHVALNTGTVIGEWPPSHTMRSDPFARIAV
jgi:hypothetical protein